MTVNELLKDINDVKVIGSDQTDVNGIELNSRFVSKGNVFVAIKGLQADGHKYINSAIENGASVICCEEMPNNLLENITYIRVNDSRHFLSVLAKRFYNHADEQLTKIAITGTNGKTSTAIFVKQLLDLLNVKSGLIGTIAYDNGKTIIDAKHTTPEVHHIQELFAEMIDNGCSHCVMEVSSHGLALNRLDGIVFQSAVFTNLSHDHLDFHKDFEDYFAAKSLLFSEHLDGVAIVNRDDEYARKVEAKEKIGFSVETETDYFVDSISISATKSTFRLNHKNQNIDFETEVIGKYNINNLLAAIIVVHQLGFDLEKIQSVFSQLNAVPGRMETIQFANAVAIVDYAHSPDALENVLKTSRELNPARLICVFGCGGDRDKLKRPVMAEAAEKFADVIFVTSDNPRTENPDAIIDDIFTGFKSNKEIYRNSDRKESIHSALSFADENDIVVIAGKGHETYQEINGERIHFDDRELIKQWEAEHVAN